MKKAVSVSLGSPSRDKVVTVQLGSETVQLERIGTNGDIEVAALKLQELDNDNTVHALSVGGANIGTYIDNVFYEYKCIQPMIRYVKNKPLVDGSGIKNVIEGNMAAFINEKLDKFIQENGGKKVFIVCGVERWELSMSFVNSGYEYIFGDFMFALGLPIPMRNIRSARIMAKILVPITTRLFPFEWLYPVGEQQNERIPKYNKYYDWATIIAGDCNYIKQHMPDNLHGKIIVTNTTTEQDVNDFKNAGVKYLVTSTPTWDGRSFGTNLLEAALVAISGKEQPLNKEELAKKVQEFGLQPHIRELN